MNTSDFDYELPSHLIAQYPLEDRSSSRLLLANSREKTIKHLVFKEIIHWIQPNDLIILNNTKVIRARLFGHKETGGKIECLIERVLTEKSMLAQIKASKAPKKGSFIVLEEALRFVVLERQDDLFLLELLDEKSIVELIDQYGKLPLPTYISRSPSFIDENRYQTVYAEKPGAVAAPTAGLHFDDELLKTLAQLGVSFAEVTLHVGAGTFQPVRTENLEEHIMHKEWMEVSEEVCEAVRCCKERGGRVIAVGTTAMRSLESASTTGFLQPFRGETQLFIKPGFRFHCVDALITNFHLPRSTLLMLVSAFGGYEFIQQAYQEAIKKEYRFYSYGDAMFITL